MVYQIPSNRVAEEITLKVDEFKRGSTPPPLNKKFYAQATEQGDSIKVLLCVGSTDTNVCLRSGDTVERPFTNPFGERETMATITHQGDHIKIKFE